MHSEVKKIELPFQGETLSIASEKIIYVESNEHRVIFYVLDNSGTIHEYSMYDQLKRVQEKLEPVGFLRIHQSYLINKEYLKSVRRYKAELEFEISLNISKKYYKEINSIYIKMLEEA